MRRTGEMVLREFDPVDRVLELMSLIEGLCWVKEDSLRGVVCVESGWVRMNCFGLWLMLACAVAQAE